MIPLKTFKAQIVDVHVLARQDGRLAN
jgi:hypothetical protein